MKKILVLLWLLLVTSFVIITAYANNSIGNYTNSSNTTQLVINESCLNCSIELYSEGNISDVNGTNTSISNQTELVNETQIAFNETVPKNESINESDFEKPIPSDLESNQTEVDFINHTIPRNGTTNLTDENRTEIEEFNGTIDNVSVDEMTLIAEEDNSSYTLDILPLLNVTLNEPADNSTLDKRNIAFNFSVEIPSSLSIKNCSLWDNSTGTWHHSQTLTADPKITQLSSYLNSTTIEQPGGLDILGDLAYVGSYQTDGIAIFNISNKYNIVQISSFINKTSLNLVKGIRVMNYSDGTKYLFAGSYTNTDRFTIINVTDPTSPAQVVSLRHSTYLDGANHICVDRNDTNIVYVAATRASRFTIINVIDKTNPTIMSSTYHATYLDDIHRIQVENNILYTVTDDTEIVSTWDVTNKYAPFLLDYFKNSSVLDDSDGLHYVDGYIYATGDHSNAMVIIDATDPTSLQQVGAFINNTSLDQVNGIRIKDDYAYLAGTGSDALIVINVTDKTNPFQVGFFTDSSLDGAYDIEIVDDYIYITASYNDTLSIFTVDRPTTFTNRTITNFDAVILQDGEYIWNVQCYDNHGSSDWSDSNYSLTILTTDSDADGVPNEDDLCPNTPLWEAVNEDGCSCSQIEILFRDCPDDQCEGANWVDYPEDGYDICEAGEIIEEYLCEAISSTYSEECDNNPIDIEIPLIQDWNLFSHSSNEPFYWLNATVTKGGETKTIEEASSSGWLQQTIYYYDAESQVYRFVPGDDVYIYSWRGYWLYSNEDDLTLTLPDVSGSLTGNSFNWMNVQIDNIDSETNSNSVEILGDGAPTISYSTGTQPDGATVAENYIFVNVSFTIDQHQSLDNITYYLYDDSKENYSKFNLDHFSLSSSTSLPTINGDASGIAYVETTGTIWVATNGHSPYLGMYEYSLDGSTLLRTITFTNFGDAEGIFVINETREKIWFGVVEERRADVTFFWIDNFTTDINKNDWATYSITSEAVENKGIEGGTYAGNDIYYFVKEKSPMRLYRMNISASPYTVEEPFNAEDKFNGIATDLSDLYYSKELNHLFILSHESNKVIELNESLDIVNEFAVPAGQREGLTFDPYLEYMYVVGEPDELLVYRRERVRPLINSTIYNTEVTEITWTNLPNGNYAYYVEVYDTAEQNARTSTRTIILNKSIPDYPVAPLNIQLFNSWNLFSHSSTEPYYWYNATITNGTETKTIAEAATSGWLQSTIYYYDAESQYYKFIPGDDNYIYSKRGYWLYSNKDDLTLIIS